MEGWKGQQATELTNAKEAADWYSTSEEPPQAKTFFFTPPLSHS